MGLLFSLFRIIRLAARIVRVVTLTIGIAGAIRKYAR